MKAYITVFFGFMLLLSMGCINIDIDQNNEDGDAGNGDGDIVLNPSFSIVHPSNGGEVETAGETADVEILLQTADMTLVAPSSTNVNGEGYFILTLNGESESVSETSYVFEGIPLGEHTLVVEFVNNDGSSYAPKLKQTVYFSVVLQDGIVLGPQEYTVNLENGAFNPDSLEIKEGDMVTFVNYESMPHAIGIKKGTVTIATSSPLITGKGYTYTFENSGIYNCISLTVPTITGSIIVSQ